MRIGQGRRDDKPYLLRAAQRVARELNSALRFRLEAAHVAAEAALVEAQRVRLNEERESS